LLALSPALRLLLTCCRRNPDVAQLDTAASSLRDWSRITSLARHHLVTPQVLLHLKRTTPGLVPMDTFAELGAEGRRAAVLNLLHLAELRQLAECYLVPARIRYLVVKGLGISARYYGHVSLRLSRDIDLLVDPDRLLELTTALMENGYRLSDARLVNNANDLRAYCAMHAEINMISPRGVVIQLHQLLDFTGCQYPVGISELFDLAEHIAIGEDTHPVMPTLELFVYIAYHHGRHQWSRLHWIADLDAIISHETFDVHGVLARADLLGMRPVVQAALDLREALKDPPDHAVKAPLSKQLISDCLRYIQEDATPPETERKSQRGTGPGIVHSWLRNFLFNWRANDHWKNRCRYIFSISRPTYADYLFLPLPESLFWLYRFLRPIRWAYEIARGRPMGDLKSGPNAQ
jgi:hypothetical protein